MNRLQTIGNDRLYRAVLDLVLGEGNAKSRVCSAMRHVQVVHKSEFERYPQLWTRIEALRRDTSKKGPRHVRGTVDMDPYEHTAQSRRNLTYTRYAREIFDIWRGTCDE